jgi:chemotaxis family two-component system response regulator Rcp1
MITPGENQWDVEILLVDDNIDDIDITLRALKKAKLLNRIHICNNGDEAMKFLRQQAPFQGVPRPDLIFLDLNMPIKDGNQTLKEIKNDPSLQLIPVVMLASSRAEEDIFRTYKNSANCFISKPLKFDELRRVIKLFDNFSLKMIATPY